MLLFVSLYNLLEIFFSHLFTFQILNCFHDFVELFVPLNFNLGVILVFFKIIQKFVHVFPKLIDFFDYYNMFFSILYSEILNREYFYRTRGLFWGVGETGYLGFSYCLCFCDETWVYGFIELGMCLIRDSILSLLGGHLVLFLLLPEFC